MYLKIHNPRESGGNSRSCAALITYLEKENLDKGLVDQEFFFDHDRDLVNGEKINNEIDGNWRGLKENDSKFFMITINPSEKELEHIGSDPKKLRDFTRSVMDDYAKGFGRMIDGRPLNASDLIYAAKIEHTRRYDPKDPRFENEFKHNYEVSRKIKEIVGSEPVQRIGEMKIKELTKQYLRDHDGNVILPGNARAGLNTHIHVVVARKDRSQRVSLSPFANAKGSDIELNGRAVRVGFNRKEFQMNCERKFDRMFDYARSREEEFEFKLSRSKGDRNYVNDLLKLPSTGKEIARRLVLQIIDRDQKLQKYFRPVTGMPKNADAVLNQAVNKAIEKVAGMLVGGSNPSAIELKTAVTRVLSIAINAGLGF